MELVERNLEYEEEIRNLLKDNAPNVLIKMLKSKGVHKNIAKDRSYLWNYILGRTSFLNTVKTTSGTRVAFCLNNVTEIPECSRKGCHNKMHKVISKSVIDPSLKQPKYCSNECARKEAQNSYVKYFQEKYGENITNGFQLQTIKDTIAQTHLKKLGVTHPMKSRNVWLKTRKKYVYDGMKFDSSWEIVYYEYLKQHDIPFEYQPKADFSYAANGTNHNYYPDFFLPNENVYVEIKDERTIKKYLESDANTLSKAGIAMQEKIKLLQRLVVERKVLLLTSAEMKPYFDWFRERYGVRYKEYLRQFKNK